MDFEAVVIVSLTGYLFYNSAKAVFIISPYIICIYGSETKPISSNAGKSRLHHLKMEFDL